MTKKNEIKIRTFGLSDLDNECFCTEKNQFTWFTNNQFFILMNVRVGKRMFSCYAAVLTCFQNIEEHCILTFRSERCSQ